MPESNALKSAVQSTLGMTDQVNQGVSKCFRMQRSVEGETRKLQHLMKTHTEQTNQWLKLLNEFNTAFKELGDVQNAIQVIEKDLKEIN